MNKLINKLKTKKTQLITAGTIALYSTPVMATQGGVPIIGGVTKLLNDALGWLSGLIPLGCALFLGFHAFKKTMSDDQAMIADCNKKMKNTLISGVVAVSAVLIVKFLLSTYFGADTSMLG